MSINAHRYRWHTLREDLGPKRDKIRCKGHPVLLPLIYGLQNEQQNNGLALGQKLIGTTL